MYAGVDRPAWAAVVAVRRLPAAMPGGSWHSQRTRVARSLHAEVGFETALPSAASGMSTMRGSGGGLALGRAVGPGDRGAVQCGGRAGARIELLGNGASVRAELEERGHDC